MTYTSAEIRQLVAERAGRRCEYCLIHEDDTFLGCEVDHIISKKHGGSNEPENLAYACLFCNRHKGTDIGSIHPNTGKLTRFYNPRKDRWGKHFQLTQINWKFLKVLDSVQYPPEGYKCLLSRCWWKTGGWKSAFCLPSLQEM
ncbi:MAG: HNH endonuclease [Thermodesulfobacteriota bacterium]|nr:HNH endonuclease [Thermodesulfobacteriota bacterium]